MSDAYDDFSGLTDKVAQAAINAAMSMNNNGIAMQGSCHQGYFTGVTRLQYPTVNGETPEMPGELAYMLVTYPAGEWYVMTGADQVESKRPFADTGYADTFSVPFDAQSLYLGWQQTIGQIFQDWWFLPGPDDFDAEIEAVKAVTAQLSAGGTFVHGSGDKTRLSAGNGDLDGWLGYIESTAGSFDGQMIIALTQNYVGPLRNSISGQQIAASVMGTLVTGEQQLWKALREDLVTICQKAADAYQALTQRSSFDWSEFFKIAGVVTSAAGIFVTGGVGATVIADAGAISGIVSSFITEPAEKPKGQISGDSLDAVTTSLRDALTSLNNGLYYAEFALQECGDQAVGYFQDNLGKIDVASPHDFLDDKGEYVRRGESLYAITPKLREMAGNFDLVGQLQRSQASAVRSGLGSGVWSRNPSIGYTATGHYNGYQSIFDLLEEALTSNARENESVARRLVQVSYDFEGTDAQVSGVLTREDNKIKAGDAAQASPR